MEKSYDALLLVSFGAPESIDQVEPFLNRITEGKNIPPDRLKEIAERYKTIGGISPLNSNIRNLKKLLEIELAIGLGSNDSLTARNTAAPPARAPNAAAKITMNTRVKVTGERFIIFFLLLLFSIYLSDNLPFLLSHLQYGL